MIYRKFLPDKASLKALSKSDRKVLGVLEDVVKDLTTIYEAQLNEGFYPKNLTGKELERAGERNNSLLDPFTFVYRKNEGLASIPYYEKYHDLLLPISQKIVKAANFSKNLSFKKYLKARAKSLLDGSYKEADIAWLSVKNSPIDFNIGPFERYLDKLMFVKRAYQAHVGIVDKKYTQIAENIKETLYSTAKTTQTKSHSTEIARRGVTVLIEWTPAISGYAADVLFSGEHFPCDLEVMQQYGSKIIFYVSQLQLKFEKLDYPIFKALFEKRFAARYSKDLLLKAEGWLVLLYELSRQLHKFPDARKRLKELYGPIDEANTFVSGIQHSKYLLMKGVLTQEELEAIMVMHIVRMFSYWVNYKHNSGLESHVIGSSIAFNTYIGKEALRESKGIFWPGFSKIFFEIEELADQLGFLLQEGTYDKAQKFLEGHAGLQYLEKLSKTLPKLPEKV